MARAIFVSKDGYVIDGHHRLPRLHGITKTAEAAT